MTPKDKPVRARRRAAGRGGSTPASVEAANVVRLGGPQFVRPIPAE